jgi:hypothetical protein
MWTLTIIKAGTGSGIVTSNPPGINCGSDCSESYSRGTAVTLTVSPASGSTFAGWSGDCADGQSPTTDDRRCVATFNLVKYTLTANKAGSGSGTVTSNPTGINCGSDCTESYLSGSRVTLTASATSDSTFAGWSGACSGTAATCTVTMDQAKTVTATFNRMWTLTIIKAGTGSGIVTSNPPGINCGSDCSESYHSGTAVTLTVRPASGSIFAGWSGDCADGQNPTTADRRCVATFNLVTYTLTANKAGNGSGTVTSNPAGIACGSDCSQSYNSGTAVTLTARPASDSTFASWSGCNSTSGITCLVTVNQAKTVTATFNKVTYLLTVGKRGNGTGTVTSSPSGINCGGDCTHRYNHGTVVTLTATARSDSVFAGWQGACSGTARTCRVTLTQARTVMAAFTQKGYYLLTVSKAGTSSGTVTSSPTGINCGSDCDHSYRSGTRVRLTARAGSSAVFAGWSGACSGRSTTCQVTLSGTRAVTATFNRRSQAGAYEVPAWLIPLEGLPESGNPGESAIDLLPWESGW